MLQIKGSKKGCGVINACLQGSLTMFTLYIILPFPSFKISLYTIQWGGLKIWHAALPTVYHYNHAKYSLTKLLISNK